VRRSCRGKTNFGNLCNSCSPAPSGMELILPAMRKVSPSGRQRRSQRADGRPERKPVACGRKTSGTTAAVLLERRSWWRAARLEEGRGAGSGERRLWRWEAWSPAALGLRGGCAKNRKLKRQFRGGRGRGEI
jgi:hypothetical protein